MTNSLDVDELIKQLLKVKQTGKQVGELIYFIVTFYQADMFLSLSRVTLLNMNRSIEGKVINTNNCRIPEVHLFGDSSCKDSENEKILPFSV